MLESRSEKKFDIEKEYVPLIQQKRFHSSPAMYRLYGGAAGGGKTHAIIWEAILRSIKYDFPVTTALFRRSFPELEATIIRSMLSTLPNWMYRYNQAQHVMTLFNGSIIEFCYAENDQDVIRYQSREWDFLGIDELTHFSEFRFIYLTTRLRSKKPLNVKFFGATNPGGIGHAWVRDRWVTKTCKESAYDASEYDFIPAKVTDNTYLMKADPGYVQKLEALPENDRKALLYGDWDIFEGMFFTEFDQTEHVVKPFDVPSGWRMILGWDDGTREPRAVYAFAIDNDNRIWVVYEYYKKGESVTDAARNIRDELQNLGYWDRLLKTVVDPSMKRVNDQTGTSPIEVLESMGFGFRMGQIEEGKNNREDGWRIVRSYMSHKPYEEPLLKIFSSCENMIRTLPQLVYYETNKGVAKKDDLDTSQEDHAADVLRYALFSLDSVPGRFAHTSLSRIRRRKYMPQSLYLNSSEKQYDET
jgi:hypothetical protein